MTEAEAIIVLAEKIEAGFAELTSAVRFLGMAVAGLSPNLTTIATTAMVLGLTAFVLWRREFLLYILGFALNFFIGIQWLDINKVFGGCLIGLGCIFLYQGINQLVTGEVRF